MSLIKPSVALLEKRISFIPFLAGLYSYPYRKVVEKEIELACIKAADKVLNVGCGAVPFTAIFLASLTGAQVWAIDRDREAVRKARQCLERMGLLGAVRVLEGDGGAVVPVDFDAAVVALQAEPKENILRNLISTALPGGRIVLRLPSPRFKGHYDSIPNYPRPAAKVRQGMHTFDRSVLFIKEQAREGEAYAL